jgi:hypothetical protein
MAIFGATDTANMSVVDLINQLYGGRYTCPEDGTAISITAYVCNDGFGNQNYKTALYKTSTGDLIAYSNTVLIAANYVGWITFPLKSHAAITNQNYDILLAAETYGSMNQDAGHAGTDCYTGYIYANPLPNPAVIETAGGTGYQTLIYCTYIPATTTPFLTGNKHR